MILVTGATGTNGSELIRQLQTRSEAVRALVRDSAAARERLGDDVELAVGNLGDDAAVRAAVRGVRAIFLLCPVHPQALDWNRRVIRIAAETATKVVRCSAFGASLGSPSRVLADHAAADAELGHSGTPFAILRPNSFFQNLLWSASSIRKRDSFAIPGGSAELSMIDVRDIGEVAVRALEDSTWNGRTLDLTGPRAVSYSAVAGVLTSVTGRGIEYQPLALEAWRQAARRGLDEWTLDAVAELHAVFASGIAAEVTGTVQEVLNRPARDLTDFVRDHRDRFCGQGL